MFVDVLPVRHLDARDEGGISMPYAGSNNALYYDDDGDGHPIVFVPGFGGIGSFWRSQIAFFKKQFRVITVDQRGTGASARTRDEYSIKQMTEDVQIVLDAAGIQRAVLVGHSTGGAIAQTLAVWAPDRIAGLLLSSTWSTPGSYFRRGFEFRRSLLELGATDLFHKAGIFFRYPPYYAEAHDAAFDSGGPVDVGITISRINAVIRADLTPLTHQIVSPTLVVASRDDMLVPHYMSEEVARRISHSRLVVLDQGGHFLPETRSTEYNGLLESFLRDLDLKAPAPIRSLSSAR